MNLTEEVDSVNDNGGLLLDSFITHKLLFSFVCVFFFNLDHSVYHNTTWQNGDSKIYPTAPFYTLRWFNDICCDIFYSQTKHKLSVSRRTITYKVNSVRAGICESVPGGIDKVTRIRATTHKVKLSPFHSHLKINKCNNYCGPWAQHSQQHSQIPILAGAKPKRRSQAKEEETWAARKMGSKEVGVPGEYIYLFTAVEVWTKTVFKMSSYSTTSSHLIDYQCSFFLCCCCFFVNPPTPTLAPSPTVVPPRKKALETCSSKWYFAFSLNLAIYYTCHLAVSTTGFQQSATQAMKIPCRLHLPPHNRQEIPSFNQQCERS